MGENVDNEDEKQIDNIGKATGFFLFRNLINNYNELKNDDTKRYECKKYGKISIILSFIGLAVAVGVILIFGVRAFGGMDFAGFGSVMSIVITIIAGIVLPIILGIYGMVFAILQIRLNRKAVGVISIILATMTILAGILMIVLMFIQ